MGKKVAAIATVVLFSASYALGGVVSFDPAVVGPEAMVMPGDTLTFDVSISGTDFANFNSAQMVIASNEDGQQFDILSFTYSTAFMNSVTPIPGQSPRTPSPFNPPKYPDGSELFIGGVNFGGNLISAPLLVGTVEVGVPLDLAPGTYENGVFVNGDLDGGASGVTQLDVDDPEFLFGSASITVIPEPATLALLGVGAVALIRRRQTA